MARPTGYVCRDFGRPLCGGVPDPRYTMRFDDIGEPPIYWCTRCGKEAVAMDQLISDTLRNDPSFANKFKKAIEEVVEERDVDRSEQETPDAGLLE